MTQPENTAPSDSPSPADHTQSHGGGVMVDPQRMSAARKSAMLERAELSDLSKYIELTRIAAEHNVNTGSSRDIAELKKTLTEAGVNLPSRLGISRDELAKLETGGRKRPRITTLRKFLDTVNYARDLRAKPRIDVEDLQVPGEVLVHSPPDIGTVLAREAEEAEAAAEAEERQVAIDAYQEISDEIRYATEEQREDAESGT